MFFNIDECKYHTHDIVLTYDADSSYRRMCIKCGLRFFYYAIYTNGNIETVNYSNGNYSCEEYIIKNIIE